MLLRSERGTIFLEKLTVPKDRKKRRPGSKRGAAKSKTAKNKAAKSSTPLVPRPSTIIEKPASEEESAFAETLIESGEAARLDKEGKLPAGATHVILEDETGKTKVVRRRFSIK